MKPFRVWVRPLGNVCRVRVDGVDNAHWLLSRLSRDYVFKTFASIQEKEDASGCSFEVAYHPSLSEVKLEQLLAEIPLVQLMLGPED